mmetsp:Transcript_14867/g.30007  ORF Transcript_14867/g.30007 Transcript_14867/m.30007 type:complete len:130 (+) Transcript_14867:616-1005(+)
MWKNGLQATVYLMFSPYFLLTSLNTTKCHPFSSCLPACLHLCHYSLSYPHRLCVCRCLPLTIHHLPSCAISLFLSFSQVPHFCFALATCLSLCLAVCTSTCVYVLSQDVNVHLKQKAKGALSNRGWSFL